MIRVHRGWASRTRVRYWDGTLMQVAHVSQSTIPTNWVPHLYGAVGFIPCTPQALALAGGTALHQGVQAFRTTAGCQEVGIPNRANKVSCRVHRIIGVPVVHDQHTDYYSSYRLGANRDMAYQCTHSSEKVQIALVQLCSGL